MNKVAVYIGIVGALGMALCDIVLLGMPVNGWQFDISSFGAMPFISQQRAMLGSGVGVVFAFLICFGFWHLRQLFSPVDPNLSNWLFISFCSVQFFGGAFHAGYYFLAEIPEPLAAEKIKYLETLSYLAVPGYVAGNILFFRLALASPYPKWLKWGNLLLIHGVLLLLFSGLPTPVGGYVKPTFINTGLAVFFFITLLLPRR